MSAAVRALEKAGAGFGDVRTEDRNAVGVRVANEQIQSVNEVHRRGWGLRAFVDGAWGYASGTSGRSADAVQAARKAVVIARRGAAAGVPPSKLRKMPSTAITLEPKVRIEPRDVAGEEKVAAAMEVCRSEKREEVANTNASYADSDWTFELANTWGACLQWREVRIRIAGPAVAGEGDRRESACEFRDGTVRCGRDAGPQDDGHRSRHLPRFPAQPRDVRRAEGPPHRQRPGAGLRPPGLGAHDEHVLRRGPRQEGRDRRGDEVRRADAQVDQRDGGPGRRVVPGRHAIRLPDPQGRGRRARARHDPDRRRPLDPDARRPGVEGNRPRRRDVRERRGGLRARSRRGTVHALQDRRQRRLTSIPSTSPRTRCGGRSPKARTPRKPM